MTRRVALAVLALAALPVFAPPAGASRAPTAREAASIRSAALRTLHGSGWRVRGIRVSTARTTHRFARASVTNRVTGVGGSMLLTTKRGRWTRRFLGTDGFCAIYAVPNAVLADLYACPSVSVAPSRVAPGGTLTVTGRNWPAGRTVTILLGPPRSEASPVGSTTADAAGRISFSFAVNATLAPGPYVVLGCRRSCRDKAAASFTLG